MSQVQLQYNYAPTTFVSLCKPVAAEFVTDAELEGPLGHVVDAFPNIQRSLVKLVYVQSRYDVQETIERLMDLNIEADTMQLQACPTPPRQPSALDSPDGQSQGPAKAVQSVSRVKACEESRHSIATLQKQGSHPGLPCAHSSPPVDAKAPSGIFTASRAFWPCWSGGEPPDRQTHQMYVLTDILPAQTAQAPSTPAFGGLAGFDASPCLTPQGSGSHVGPLPAAVVAAASSTSASPDRPSLGLQAYQAPPPPVARLAPEAVPEADLPTEEQSMEFLQGMFPDLGLAVVEDAFLTAERDVDAAMCHLMQMQMKDEPGMGSLPSLPDTSQASDDGTDFALPTRTQSCLGTRPTSPDHHVAPADSDYTFRDLNLEQKVKRLQKEHPGLTAGYLQHALEASDLDLSLATALVLSAEEGSPQTPDAEAKRAQEEADAAIAAALQQKSEQEQTDHQLAFSMQHSNGPPPPPHGFVASPARALVSSLRVSPAKSHTSDGTSGSGQAHGKGDAAARRRIKALKRTFPEVSEDWASQVLLACNGDLAQAKQAMLDAGLQAAPGQSMGPPMSQMQAAHMLGFKSPSRPGVEVVREDTDVLYKRVREKVRQHKDRQYHYVHEMRLAMHRGNRDLSRMLEQRPEPVSPSSSRLTQRFERSALQAKQEGHLAAIAQQEAAETTAMAMNSHNVQQFKVDLHGLHVEEALQYTCTFLEQGWGFCLATKLPALVKLITGRGNHSEGNQPRILPAVKKFLTKEGIDFVAAPGCFSVGFRHASNGQAYAHYDNVVDNFPRRFSAP